MDVREGVLEGNAKTVGRLLTDLENGEPGALETLGTLYRHTGKAHILGVTGAPGVGKSTLISSMTRVIRQKGLTIGILAVDPTSPFSGGALLGDRVRMQEHGSDPGVFIRSLATRGGAGGLSRAALGMAHVLDAMGKDVIIVETVGIGQSEIEITKITDTSILVLVPGYGDTIQLMKAGILEAADIIVVNRANEEGAENLRMELEFMIGAKQQHIVRMADALTGQGIEEVVDSVLRHQQTLTSSGELARRRRQRARQELLATYDSFMKANLEQAVHEELERLTDDLVCGRTDPTRASREIMKCLLEHLDGVSKR